MRMDQIIKTLENTKFQESEESANQSIKDWCKEQGATESITFDEETGAPMQTFTIDLTKDKKDA